MLMTQHNPLRFGTRREYILSDVVAGAAAKSCKRRLYPPIALFTTFPQLPDKISKGHRPLVGIGGPVMSTENMSVRLYLSQLEDERDLSTRSAIQKLVRGEVYLAAVAAGRAEACESLTRRINNSIDTAARVEQDTAEKRRQRMIRREQRELARRAEKEAA